MGVIRGRQWLYEPMACDSIRKPLFHQTLEVTITVPGVELCPWVWSDRAKSAPLASVLFFSPFRHFPSRPSFVVVPHTVNPYHSRLTASIASGDADIEGLAVSIRLQLDQVLRKTVGCRMSVRNVRDPTLRVDEEWEKSMCPTLTGIYTHGFCPAPSRPVYTPVHEICRSSIARSHQPQLRPI